MSVELLNTLSFIAYIVSAVFLIIALSLFFLFNIPKQIGDISGATAKKAIKAIRLKNENTGNKSYKPSLVNVSRGKITDKISPSGKIERRASDVDVCTQTEKFDTTELLEAAQATMLLHKSDETTLIDNNESGVTELLSDMVIESKKAQPPNIYSWFKVDVEIGFIGSTELIE